MIPAFPLLYSVPIAVKAHVPDGRVRAHHLVLMVASQRLTQLLTIPSLISWEFSFRRSRGTVTNRSTDHDPGASCLGEHLPILTYLHLSL